MSTGQTLLGQCTRCGGILEFNSIETGRMSRCYHCGLDTQLAPGIHFDPMLGEVSTRTQRSKLLDYFLVTLAVIALAWNLAFLTLLFLPGGEQQLMQMVNDAPFWR